MELKGKKINFLGDSITEGVGASEYAHCYVEQFAAATGAVCRNYGIGGTRIARRRVPYDNPIFDQDFPSRVPGMDPDADVVVVFGGTNDFGDGDAALGHMEDRTEDTFYGAYHLLIRKLLNRYPDGKLVVMTPLHRMSEDETDYNERGVRRVGSLQRYADAIIEVAGFYGVPVVDLFRTSGIQPRVDILREKYMPDGLHPNDEGHALLAQRLLTVLNAI